MPNRRPKRVAQSRRNVTISLRCVELCDQGHGRLAVQTFEHLGHQRRYRRTLRAGQRDVCEQRMALERLDDSRHTVMATDPKFLERIESLFYGRDFKAAEDKHVHHHGTSDIKFGR